MTQAALRSNETAAAGPRVGLKSLLLVGLKKEAVESLVPQLRKRAVEVATTASGSIAVAACRQRRYDLIIVREPIADLDLEAFLDEMRTPGGLCESAHVQVVTGPRRLDELSGFAGGRIGVCSVTDFGSLSAAISRVILGVAPRVALRLMVELIFEMDGGRLSRFCQVENVSESGLLIRSSDLIPVGESVEIALSIPGSAQAQHMTARVVRHTGAHEIVGFALTITGFRGAAEKLWRDYLRRELARAETAPLHAAEDVVVLPDD